MSNQPPSSFPPPGHVPGASSNRQYIVLAAIFFIVTAGVLAWKFFGSSDTVVKAPTPVSSTLSRPSLVDAPPPPPTDEPSAAVVASAPTKATTAGNGCGICTTKASSALQSEIGVRARRAQGCYERALRQNANLQGKLSLAVKVDQSGNVCAANITNDTIGAPDVSNCITSMFRGQHLAAGSVGGCSEIVVPLNFQPKK